MGELVARVNSHLKTYEKFRHSSQKKQIKVGALSIDKEDHRVFIDGHEVLLTQKEFELLLFFMENPNRVYSKEELFEKVWGYDALSDATTITVHIARIREKAGYRFKI